MLSSVFAHQGGWDEILFVVVPIAIFAGLLAVANRRASRIEDQRTQGSDRDGGARNDSGGDGRGSPGRRAEPSPRRRGRDGRPDR